MVAHQTQKQNTKENSREFWLDIGLKLGQVLESSKLIDARFDAFISNEFKHLSERVESNTRKIYMGIGILIAAQFAITIAARLLF